MGPLRLATLALAFAVAIPVAGADGPSSSSSSSRSERAHKKKKAAKAKAKARAKAKRAKARALAKREKQHHRHEKTKANMPPGWSWPPTKAMIAAGETCTKKLDALGIGWDKAEPEGRITTPITLRTMELGGLKLVSVYRKGPFTMDCHLAVGLATYGPQLVALGVTELHFSSIYRNTKVRVNGQTKNALSRHALGLAIDVRSFIDNAGREAVVQTDYNAADPMLLKIEQTVNDSGGFRTVLTPRNDPTSHYDHFHLEIQVEYPPPADNNKPAT